MQVNLGVKRGTISRNSFSRPAFTARSCGPLFLLGRAAPHYWIELAKT